MAGFIATGLIFQSLYFFVDLYFVSRLGKDAIAGVSAAGNFNFLALAAAQMLSVGALSLISQAVGRKDEATANLVFNQVVGMSVICFVGSLVAGYALAGIATASLGADAGSSQAGRDYLYGFMPAIACAFPGAALGASLRATGVVRPTMLLQSGSILLNVLLAPVLIAGWGTGHPLGAFGAGLASSIASLLSLVAIAAILPRIQGRLSLHAALMSPRPHVWLDVLKVGLPAGGEFMLIFTFTAIIYWSIRRFGPAAQAGYGIGARIMQMLFLPVMAVSFAAAPVAGQNFGAGQHRRLVETFRFSALIGGALMLALTLFCQIRPDLLIGFFSKEPSVLAVGVQFLSTISWNFTAVGIIFACTGMFQGLGDTMPSFLSSASRIVTFMVPCILLSRVEGATLADFWRLSIISAALQAAVSLVLLRREFGRKLEVKEGLLF
jgi:putative MATE family efflux protein